jgi:beta-lactamase class A
MKKICLSILLFIVLLIPISSEAQVSLHDQIEQIAKPAKAIVGVSVLNLETGDTVNYNGKARLVMHSVMKFPIALTILHLVDSGTLKLDQMIHVTKKDMQKTYSPLRDKYPKGDVDVSVSDLLSYMVSQSDNDACDILLRVLNGPQTVQAFMLRSGIRGIAVRASEADMASAWELQYTNWCKPVEMTLLLQKFYQGKILSKTSTDFLYKIMTETTTGPKRIKGLLPDGTVVAHKTGTSPTNADGLSPATNDVGIITLPNGNHLIVSIFVCNSKDDEATRDSIIAKIAKASYDFYNK